MADEFGGEIPVGPFALIGDDSIGRASSRRSREPVPGRAHARTTARSRSAPTPAPPSRPRSWSRTSPRTVHVARQLGEPDAHRASRHRRALRPLPERLRTGDRPVNACRPPPTPSAGTRSGSSPAARASTARTCSSQVPDQSRQVADALGASAAIPVTVVGQAGAHRRGGDPRACCSRRTPTTACIGVIAWMHTFSPAKMWIAGLDAAAQAAAAPAHPGQRRAAVGRRSTWTS